CSLIGVRKKFTNPSRRDFNMVGALLEKRSCSSRMDQYSLEKSTFEDQKVTKPSKQNINFGPANQRHYFSQEHYSNQWCNKSLGPLRYRSPAPIESGFKKVPVFYYPLQYAAQL